MQIFDSIRQQETTFNLDSSEVLARLNPEQELQLREDFFTNFTPIIKDFVTNTFPNISYPENAHTRLAHYLYGIYLVNHLTDNLLLSRRFGANELKATEKDHFDEDDNFIWGQLDIQDLNDWPLNWYPPTSKEDKRGVFFDGGPEYRAQAQYTKIAVPMSEFRFGEPNATFCTTIKPKQHLLDKRISVTATNLEDDIRTGWEEALHMIQRHAKTKHKSDKLAYRDISTKAEVDSRVKHLKKEGGITYYTELGVEFGCFLMWAELVKNYLPKLWGNGYSEAYSEVIKQRQVRLEAKGLSADPKLFTFSELIKDWNDIFSNED